MIYVRGRPIFDSITMSGTWIASGTVTLPAFNMGGDLNMVAATNRIGSGTTDLAISGALNAAANLGTRIDAAANGVWLTVYEINNVAEVGVANIKMAWYGGVPVIQQAGIINADGTLADITTKFNALIAELEAYGLLVIA